MLIRFCTLACKRKTKPNHVKNKIAKNFFCFFVLCIAWPTKIYILSNKFSTRMEEEERISLKMTYHYIFHISTRNVIVKWRHNLKMLHVYLYVCMFVWITYKYRNSSNKRSLTNKKLCLHLVMISFSASSFHLSLSLPSSTSPTSSMQL